MISKYQQLQNDLDVFFLSYSFDSIGGTNCCECLVNIHVDMA